MPKNFHAKVVRNLASFNGKNEKWCVRLKSIGINRWYDRSLWFKFEDPGSWGAHSAEHLDPDLFI